MGAKILGLKSQRDQRILLCYGKTPFTPGRFLEDALRRIGAPVDLGATEIDFGAIDLERYRAILFVESPSKKSIAVRNINRVKIPKLFWIHHGAHRWHNNLVLCKRYQPDLLLMAHSLYLAKKSRLTLPVYFFPFAMDKKIFNSAKPLKQRAIDITFVGNKNGRLYQKRRKALRLIKDRFKRRYRLSLTAKKYLHQLAKRYSNSKIVFNISADGKEAINMRIFEGMGSGALVVTDLAPDQDRIFTDCKHYVVYKNFADLKKKLRYYLTHLDEAQKIATAGRRYLLSRHTYEHRAKQLLGIINDL